MKPADARSTRPLPSCDGFPSPECWQITHSSCPKEASEPERSMFSFRLSLRMPMEGCEMQGGRGAGSRPGLRPRESGRWGGRNASQRGLVGVAAGDCGDVGGRIPVLVSQVVLSVKGDPGPSQQRPAEPPASVLTFHSPQQLRKPFVPESHVDPGALPTQHTVTWPCRPGGWPPHRLQMPCLLSRPWEGA